VAGRVRTLAGLSLPALGLLTLAGPGRAVDPARADPAPSAELLLFLAEFRDARGNDVDPIALAEQAEAGAAPKQAPGNPKPPRRSEDERDEPRHESSR